MNYALTGVISVAAAAATIHRDTYLNWRKKDDCFARAADQAKEVAADLLEEEARRRAYDGVDEPVVYKGKLQGIYVDEDGKPVSEMTPGAMLRPLTIKKYDTTLLIFLLKGMRPEKYRDRHDIRIDYTALRTEAERIAKENDLPVAEVVAEAERIAQGAE